ncbi:VOC family protein [Deinococcus sp.]|uniref:VOC family protein n=1 Tax=Deinococcus sp. TaxID=47478 RepID=UPI003CC61880
MLTNLTLAVLDPERSRRFYMTAFGLPETGQSAPGMALLELGHGVTLLLQDVQASSAAPTPGGVELGFEVEDVEGTRHALLALGAEVGEMQAMGWGGGFDARDPDGHALSIFRKRE